MLSAFSTRTRVKVEYFFPVRGHSYLPADRAFGRVKKRLRKIETILLPSEYYNEFRSVGEVHEYPRDWSVYDLKKFARGVLKSKQTCEISQQLRLEISGATFKAWTSFEGAMKEFSILKRGKNFSDFGAPNLRCQPNNRMKAAKKKDVLRLLNVIAVSESHPAHAFYKNSCSPDVDNEEEEVSVSEASAVDSDSSEAP